MQIKMLALDLDGTLALADHQVSPATREALEELHRDNIEVVIATGRRYRTTRFVIKNLGFDVFAVCNGGAMVKRPDQRTLHKETFDVGPLAALARELELSLFAQRDAHDLGGADFIIDDHLPLNAWTENYHHDNRQWSDRQDMTRRENEFLVAGVFGPHSQLSDFAEQIQRHLPDAYNTILVPQQQGAYYYCEISQQHINKWHGLSKLADHLDLTSENICTVGDEVNDISMITAVPHGIAMGNGNKELQELARFVCGHNTEDGIVDVIDYIRSHNDAL